MSIRVRLLSLALCATLLPALLVGARFHQDRALGIEQASLQLSAVTEKLARDIDERIQGTAQLHFGLARARDLDSGDRHACSRFLSEVREEYPQYTGILTINPDATLFCDSLMTGRNLDLRDRGYFKEALSRVGTVTLEPAFGRLTGIAVLQIAYPARADDGTLRFVLLASLNLRKLVEDYGPPPFGGMQIVIVDQQGQILVWVPRAGQDAIDEGSLISESTLFRFAVRHAGGPAAELDRGNGPQVWSVSRPQAAGHAGLYVMAGVDKSQLSAAADRRMRTDALLLGGVVLVLFLAVWLLVEVGIRWPVARIGDMVQRLGAGELTARIEPPHPRGEFGELMAVLNRTAQSLQQQRSQIGELNERLRQSQRLESVGQLTGGVAHDFNNLLTVILGNAELLEERLVQDARGRMLAEMIASAAQRGAELTQRLLAFARKQALDPKVVDVNRLVSGMERMLRRTLGEHVEIELVRAAGLWRTLIDPGQLENALLNLAINARDAMQDGGRLTIETANVRLDREYADQHLEVQPGQYVLVAVSDNGSGIAPEIIDRVFEPFFTTKETGKGTGLGLAMVYGFIKQSGGHVNIYSEPGQGTTVKLYLPRALESGETVAGATTDRAVARGAEIILVVEDDELVRRYTRTQLETLGYCVVEAEDGPSALRIVRERSDIDLLFTDVVMPGGMNGRELADEATKLRPGLKVLYTSGYTENAIVHHGRLDAGVNLLGKPYQRAELARRVREVLDGGQTTRGVEGP